MKKEELAELLNGRSYGNEIENDEAHTAETSGLIVIFGASDDLVEFRGAIYDELSAYGGADFVIATPGMEVPFSEDDETYRKAKVLEPIPIEEESITTVNRFSALWCPGELGCSWLIKTELPHSSFDIMEEGELYCRGIVVDVKSLS